MNLAFDPGGEETFRSARTICLKPRFIRTRLISWCVRHGHIALDTRGFCKLLHDWRSLGTAVLAVEANDSISDLLNLSARVNQLTRPQIVAIISLSDARRYHQGFDMSKVETRMAVSALVSRLEFVLLFAIRLYLHNYYAMSYQYCLIGKLL